jgi:alkanesulfonate monooxygenase SsuD/methylene tetrahydromethanopterin reductase-like flavin-dependent oxidoreductase (luciferase family)
MALRARSSYRGALGRLKDRDDRNPPPRDPPPPPYLRASASDGSAIIAAKITIQRMCLLMASPLNAKDAKPFFPSRVDVGRFRVFRVFRTFVLN